MKKETLVMAAGFSDITKQLIIHAGSWDRVKFWPTTRIERNGNVTLSITLGISDKPDAERDLKFIIGRDR